MKKILIALSISISALTLQACVPILVGSAAAGSALYVKTDEGFKSFYSDTDITNQAIAKLKADSNINQNSRIIVTTKNGTVLLVGEVSSPDQRTEAEQAIQSVPGIQRVYNAITVSGPISSLTLSSDSWITAKIKSQMTVTKNFPGRDIKVITENGVVYLLGNVTQDQGNTAANIARQVTGVQKVVKLFQYTS